MRIDKFLWCVRRFKTRALATDAIKREQVKLDERMVKPSAEVRVGCRISIREAPIWRSWEVIALPASRIGAGLVPAHFIERSSAEDLELLERARLARAQDRDRGEGRPTKRDRRNIERFIRG